MAAIKSSGEYSPVGSAVFSQHYGCSDGNHAVLSLLQLLQTNFCPAPLGRHNARVPVDVGSSRRPHTSSHLHIWHMDPRPFLKAKCTFTQAHPTFGEHGPIAISDTVIS